MTPVCGAVLIALAAAIAAVDLRERRIPDALSLALAAAGAACALAAEGRVPWERAVAGALAMVLLWAVGAGFSRLRGVRGLGLGDIKMTGAAAFWVLPWDLPLVLAAACAAALLGVAAATLAGRPPGRLTRIPFGPFIGAGTVLVWGLEASGMPTLVPAGM